jgi:diguanylate cyclase (GGDEF)-like protein/PAS domain S-box-containing protein
VLAMLCLVAAAWAGLAGAAAVPAHQEVPRHPLEVRALSDPDGVLSALSALLHAAESARDYRQLSLLRLTQANACRVKAAWTCQRDAGVQARLAAEAGALPVLAVRGLIAEARGRISMQDFTRGEYSLGDAERRLAIHPFPELKADVLLAYSSLSYTLGKHAAAADYAQKGLDHLGDIPAPTIRVRLLRNRANALAQLGRRDEAKLLVEKGLELSGPLNDPKLGAELYLEHARIARLEGDAETAKANGRRILELAQSLRASQLIGLGHEMLGLAAHDQGDLLRAEAEFRAAVTSFHAQANERDERRVLRLLVAALLDRPQPPADLPMITRRLLHLETALDSRDQMLAGDDLDARLKYAQQEFDVQRLQASAALTHEREATLAGQQRFALVIAGLSIGLLVLVGSFYLSQRWLNSRLRQAVSRLSRSEQELSASESRLRTITDSIPALISRIDMDQRYRFVNALSVRVFGMQPEALIGKALLEVRGPEQYQLVKPHVEAALRGEAVNFEGSIDLRGELLHYQTSFVPDQDANGELQGFFSFTFDITRLKLAEAELDRIARSDSLTGVSNRRDFGDKLDAALARCRREEEGIALLCLDIDRFKEINDGHGHLVGDAVILAFADRLKTVLREDDLIARLGGDEFMVLLENPGPETSSIVADKIVAAMREPIRVNDLSLPVSVSIGVAYSPVALPADQLMSRADAALYAAKSAGRNNWRAAPVEAGA